MTSAIAIYFAFSYPAAVALPLTPGAGSQCCSYSYSLLAARFTWRVTLYWSLFTLYCLRFLFTRSSLHCTCLPLPFRRDVLLVNRWPLYHLLVTPYSRLCITCCASVVTLGSLLAGLLSLLVTLCSLLFTRYFVASVSVLRFFCPVSLSLLFRLLSVLIIPFPFMGFPFSFSFYQCSALVSRSPFLSHPSPCLFASFHHPLIPYIGSRFIFLLVYVILCHVSDPTPFLDRHCTTSWTIYRVSCLVPLSSAPISLVSLLCCSFSSQCPFLFIRFSIICYRFSFVSQPL